MPDQAVGTLSTKAAPTAADYAVITDSADSDEVKRALLLSAVGMTNQVGYPDKAAKLIVYDPTLAAYRAVLLSKTPPNLYAEEYFSVIEHFGAGAAGLLSANTANSGANTAAISEADAPGVVQSTTSTTTNGRAGYVYNSNAFVFGVRPATFRSRLRASALSNGTDTYALRTGFGNGLNTEATYGVFFRYTHSVNSGNWQLVARANGVESVVNTAVAPVITGWQKLDIVVNANASSVEGFIDGVSIGTVTTNIPTGTTGVTGLMHWLAKSAGTTAVNMFTDYVVAAIGPNF